MDLEKLCEEIKKEGAIEPQVGIVTPEIRTIDERVKNNVTYIKSIDDITENKE